MKALRIIASLIVAPILILLGIVGTPFSLLALADPVGAKMSDDADPLGPPPTTTESMWVLAGYLLMLAVGLLIVIGTCISISHSNKATSTNSAAS